MNSGFHWSEDITKRWLASRLGLRMSLGDSSNFNFLTNFSLLNFLGIAFTVVRSVWSRFNTFFCVLLSSSIWRSFSFALRMFIGSSDSFFILTCDLSEDGWLIVSLNTKESPTTILRSEEKLELRAVGIMVLVRRLLPILRSRFFCS